MLLASALKGMSRYREALLDANKTSDPSYISENNHRFAQYIAAVDEKLADLEAELIKKESNSFNEHVASGKSANAAKELVRREFAKEKAEVAKLTRLTASGWRLVNQSQSRIKNLQAEAQNQY